jgi:hypothetical protein
LPLTLAGRVESERAHAITAAEQLPDDLRQTLDPIHGRTVLRTNLSQLRNPHTSRATFLELPAFGSDSAGSPPGHSRTHDV